jgi:predicted nucleotidyltransferase
MDREQIFTILRSHQAELASKSVCSLAVFGSVARGDFSPESDLDLLVQFDQPVGLFEFIRLKLFLEQITGCKVDLVTPDAIRSTMRERILGEAIDVG